MIRAIVIAGLLLTLAGCSGDSTPASSSASAEKSNRNANRTYLHYCSGCHGAPRPGQYTAREWPSIVARMQQRRISARLGPIPPQDLREILDYLQANAAGGPVQ
jgi:cytochrome c553